MEIKFQSKEESNKRQEEEFLALSREERFLRFIELSNSILKFPSKSDQSDDSNFQLIQKK
jgi:hypothetical protein